MFAALATPIITEALIKEGRNHPQGTITTGCLPLNTQIIRFSFQQLSFVSTLTKHCSLCKLLQLFFDFISRVQGIEFNTNSLPKTLLSICGHYCYSCLQSPVQRRKANTALKTVKRQSEWSKKRNSSSQGCGILVSSSLPATNFINHPCCPLTNTSTGCNLVCVRLTK